MKRHRARLSAASKLLRLCGYGFAAAAALVMAAAFVYGFLVSRGFLELPAPELDASIAYLSVRLDVSLSPGAGIALVMLRGAELSIRLAFYGFVSLCLAASMRTAVSGADFAVVASVLSARSGTATILSVTLGAFAKLGIALVLSAPVAAAGYVSSPGFDIDWSALLFGLLLLGLSFAFHDYARAKRR